MDLPETEAELFQLESYPLLDVDNGIQCLGNESLLNELLGQMINEHFPETILTLKQAYTNNDWIIIEKTTHKMKGGAVYCGTIRLKYACQYLERYQKTGHTQHLNALYLQLEKVVEEQ